MPYFETNIEAGQDGDFLLSSPRTQFSMFGSYFLLPSPLGMVQILVNPKYSWQGNVLSFLETSSANTSLNNQTVGASDGD